MQEGSLTLGSREDLEQRLSLVPPGDSARGLVFTTTLEMVREEAGEAALSRCIEAAEGASFIYVFNYPMRALLRLLYTAAWELSDRYEGFEQAMSHLGARTAPDFLESTMGRMLMAMAGMNVRRLVSGVPVAYPTIYAHGSCTLRWLGASSCQLLLQGNVLPPPFLEGGLLHVLRAARAPKLVVQVRRVALTENELTISWR
jgi:uncharacterized protein (TIGR02265 family)